MDQDRDSTGKRPYERPTLVPSSVFGAEAAVGSCCRTGVCDNAARDSARVNFDGSKARNSTIT